MELHRQLSDTSFLMQFKSCTLNPSVFTHEAHLRLAWLLIQKNGIQAAIDNIQHLIKNYVKALGTEDKYHATLTVAAIHIVNHFILKSNDDNFPDFIQRNTPLRNSFKELIESHYSTSLLNSTLAKASYQTPDLHLFD